MNGRTARLIRKTLRAKRRTLRAAKRAYSAGLSHEQKYRERAMLEVALYRERRAARLASEAAPA